MTSRVFNLLLVDDDPLVHQAIKILVPTHWRVFSAQVESLVPYERFFHLALIDMHLEADHNQAAGPRIIEKLLKRQPQTDIIAISGDLSRELMESCLKVGAQKFLAKPIANDELSLLLEKTEAHWDLRSIDGLQESKKTKWIGNGQHSQALKKQIAQLRGEAAPVLIEGETGTGKEVTARLLHEQENQRPYVTVNMASLPENLFESELFGHVKGAFTGAEQNKLGLIEAANGGDLFLDEIEAMPLQQQVKLLRFLESGEIRRVGAKENIYVRTRVIAASNQPLQKMVAAGEFREDLYFRLCSHKINLPALRDRKEDIKDLAVYFIDAERPKRNKKWTEDGLEALLHYDWPGNIRELKRVCEQLSLVSPLPIIRQTDVQNILFVNKPTIASEHSTTTLDLTLGLSQLSNQYEALIIREALKLTKDIEKAADLLQVSRSNLYKKLKDHQIQLEEYSR